MGFFNELMKIFNPAYQLILTDKVEGGNDKGVVYVFKQYGSHEFFHVTYSDILDNENLLYAIHPLTISEIAESEALRNKLRHNKKRITKEIKGNNYEIGGSIYSGDYVCNNIDMFFDLNVADVCHIARSTGFFSGREFSKMLTKKLANLENKNEMSSKKSQVIDLRSVQRKIHSDS